MIRFKVVRASRLLIGFAIALLVIVLAVLILRLAMAQGAEPAATQQGNSSIVTTDGTQEAVAAFAAAASLSGDKEPDELHENEHTDSVAPGMMIEKIPYDADAGQPPLPLRPDVATPAPAQKPREAMRVLIYHTHTNEAYAQDPADPYKQTEPWRTTDRKHSIVRVGDELAQLLSARGFEVVHDTTDHEPPKLGTAYERSLLTLAKYKDAPFDLYIDLHRDAAAEGQKDARVVLSGAGKPCAQLMMLIGKADGAEFAEKPDFQANYRFARQLTAALNAIQPGIGKDVLVKTNRYNQHIGTPAILIEVGDNLNTLSQALGSMPQLGEAISRVMGGEVFPEPTALPASAKPNG